ncbi:hypothetical protein CG747_32135 [Streptomyces sp. CB02959]|uniref:hypothetical protein n=1 Tax=Streptomyces sp. CB02959 TaxID=2020330 RepID=UPI000C27AF21|nr:hypothetical protein [Streptomyces sp. CB02959]PJN36592.1 hypothetical protein CG747_32135 [Streptomyces sp. CB02959]
MKQQKRNGVRIPWVWDSRDDAYDRSAIDIKPHPPYVLPLRCGGCKVDVSVRPANADDPDSRSSHFFTMPGRKHKLTCNFDLPRRGKELVDSSKGTVVRREGQWRLKCPPLSRPGTRGNAKGGGPQPQPPRTAGGGGTPAVSKLRGPAIASARRIIQLLESFKHDPQTVAEFAAVAPSGQRNIAWDDFCVGPATAHQLAQKLIDGTGGQIPHAVWGPASTAGPAGQRGDSYVVMYVARHPVLIEGQPVKVRVAVRCKAGEWIGADTSSGKFLGYGYWELFPKGADWAHKSAERGWIELQLWVKEPWQVERWGTVDGSAPLPKPTPPWSRLAPASVSHPASDPAPAKPSLPAKQKEDTAPPAVRADEPERHSTTPASTTGPRTSESGAEPATRPAAHPEPIPNESEQQDAPPPAADPPKTETPAPAAEDRPASQVSDAPVLPPRIPPPPPHPPTVAPSPRTGIRGWLKRLRGR